MAFEPDVPPIQVHLWMKGSTDAICWYEEAFGAVETYGHMGMQPDAMFWAPAPARPRDPFGRVWALSAPLEK
jgi:uncharacterized glyoxalase superfamily protein PhnB